MADSLERHQTSIAKIPAQVVDRVVSGLRQGFRSRTILMLSLANGIFFAASAPYWLEWPQYVNDSYGLGIWVVGWVYCLLTIGRLAGAEIVMRIRMDEASRSTRLIILIAAAGAVFFAGAVTARRPNLVVALFILGVETSTGTGTDACRAFLEAVQTAAAQFRRWQDDVIARYPGRATMYNSDDPPLDTAGLPPNQVASSNRAGRVVIVVLLLLVWNGVFTVATQVRFARYDARA